MIKVFETKEKAEERFEKMYEILKNEVLSEYSSYPVLPSFKFQIRIKGRTILDDILKGHCFLSKTVEEKPYVEIYFYDTFIQYQKTIDKIKELFNELTKEV